MVKPVAHPLHPSIASRIDSEYEAFHNDKLLYFMQVHEIPWSPAVRSGPTVPGGSQPLVVGTVKDYSTRESRAPWLRVFTPEGEPPAGGWPVFIFFHGGGWTLGNINSENAFSTNMCKYAKCVVVSVDYRLAPENPYPAAVEDAVEALQWVHAKGQQLLAINPDRIAVGGSSSGGNLAAVIALKSSTLEPPIPLVFQLLVVPVTDNTATPESMTHQSWKENEFTTWLPAAKMIWFQDQYVPNVEDRTRWDNSPHFAPPELFSNAPPAWIGVTELDVLRDEGIAFGKKLTDAGKAVETKVYKGSPHPIMAMDGKISSGQQLVADAAAALAKAFGGA
ncbi:alpha/beta hydrolase fold-domain-containing protein [Vararia minispora EC-137]|uniref:Alpha/beta hydrolase fold-domain-containing protein n=1 Tax=Vararia minispora EC-137 TaxID=1314806 RepID=A0ACB8QN17_9AGAM|nr:alpha/beta hydrolase fold-domain-containing protein [Vararia minispora EC-137]